MQKVVRNCAHFKAWTGLVVALAASTTACRAPETSATAEPAASTGPLACGERGFLSATLYGAIAVTLEWTEADLECAGMPRPDGEGARLRFAASHGDRPLAIIIAVPGLERGRLANELASNVTLIEEGSGRFFNTTSLENCWTDITWLEPLTDTKAGFAIGGNLYCVAPLAEVNGNTSVSVPELGFRGLIDWDAS